MPVDNDGSATLPTFAFMSERSLGLFRSGVSTIGLSYGALAHPAGSAIAPSIAFSSETSLGIYRSAASTLANSYGTVAIVGFLTLTANSGSLPQVQLFSGSGNNGQFAFGRSAVDAYIFCANFNGNFWNNVIAGDSGLASSSAATLHLGNAGSLLPQLSLVSTGGRGLVNFNQSGLVSVRTVGGSLDSTNLTKGEAGFTIIASGASFAIQSGSTIFYFLSSTSTKAP